MKNLKIFYLYLLPGFFLLVHAGCAKMGSITGGPVDKDPPKIVNSKPENYSSNFTGKKIEITFNEFIFLNNVNQALVISPPLTGKPEIRLRGKTLQINLEGEYRENTTYTLNFGNAIEDVHERNIMENFEFVFSTGNNLDSLSVKGNIVNAFDLKPSEDPFIIMAYDKLEDSIPLKEPPVYVGRSDKKGVFGINNMKEDTFRIFAIKDVNMNYIFDLPNEIIAFYSDSVYLFTDSLLTEIPDSLFHLVNDTMQNDSISIRDTEQGDTLLIKESNKKHLFHKPFFMDLYFFEEDNRTQYLIDNERKEDKHIFLVFNLPLPEKLSIKSLNFDTENWYLEEANTTRDTFNIWITDSSIIKYDTLTLLLNYPGTDSSGNYKQKEDTLILINRIKQTRGKVKEEVKKPVLTVNTISNKSNQDLHKDILFTFNYPVDNIDTSKIFLFSVIDSAETNESFTMKKDTLSLRKHFLIKQWKSKMKYRLFAEPGAFTDIYGISNDSITINFSAQDEEFYGILHVNTSNVKDPLLIQLMSEKEEIYEEKYIMNDASVSFHFLKPGKYKLKYIYDMNKNHKWDTGRYLEKRQPERVEYYEGEIAIRSNWEMEIKWNMKR